MGAETAAAMAIAGVAQGVGSYFGADKAADAAADAKDYFRRQLGDIRQVRGGYEDESSYWATQAREQYQALVGSQLGPEGNVPSRAVRRQAAEVGRQMSWQQVASGMGPLGPMSAAASAEARVVNELMGMAKRENLQTLQLVMRQSEALRRDVLGALQLENQATSGMAEAQMAKGAYKGQAIQGLIGGISEGLTTGATMYGLGQSGLFGTPGQQPAQQAVASGSPALLSPGGLSSPALAAAAGSAGQQAAGPGMWADPNMAALLMKIGAGGV